jgi:hypothetical protein
MDEPGWIDFHTAAAEMAQDYKSSQGRERQRLREACRDGQIISMKAPYDGPSECDFARQLPKEFWVPVAPHEWRERDVDYDGPEANGSATRVMLNEKDWEYWRGTLKPPKQGLSVRSGRTPQRKRDAAKDAIKAMWPQGIPEGMANKDLVSKVAAWQEEQGHSVPSSDTILRAAGRKR